MRIFAAALALGVGLVGVSAGQDFAPPKIAGPTVRPVIPVPIGKPVTVLPRNTNVASIVNMTAFTVIKAQAADSDKKSGPPSSEIRRKERPASKPPQTHKVGALPD